MRTFLIALLTGVAGAVLAYIGGELTTRAHHVSNMEGGRAMLVVFLLVPAGLVAGIVVGVVVALNVRGPGLGAFARAQGLALLVTAGLAALVFGYAYWRAPRPPRLGDQHLRLDFEVRMPEARAVPAPGEEFTVLLLSRGHGDDRHNADLRLDAAGRHDGRVVIPGSAFLYTTTTQRFLVINDVDGKHYWFDLPLRARPREEDEAWTEWWPKPGEKATADVHGNGGFQIRYRVQRTAEP